MKRFWDKVEKTDGCWNWKAYIGPDGYGRFGFRGKIPGPHRVSWELSFGPIPDGLNVCHKCDNRRCVRPDHLFLGTDRDNILDCIRKGRRNTRRGYKQSAEWIERRMASIRANPR